MTDRRWLALSVYVFALFQIACSGGGGGQQCDITCQQFYASILKQRPDLAKSLANALQQKNINQKGLAEVLAEAKKNGVPAIDDKTLAQVLEKNGIKPASVTSEMIHAHAEHVSARLEADKHNPESPFYEPAAPSSDLKPSATREPSAAPLAPTSIISEPQSPPPHAGGATTGGETTR